jgi:hypothetical protein
MLAANKITICEFCIEPCCFYLNAILDSFRLFFFKQFMGQKSHRDPLVLKVGTFLFIFKGVMRFIRPTVDTIKREAYGMDTGQVRVLSFDFGR